MDERSIMFSDAMVRAILAGRKTQTRRLAWKEGDGAKIASGWQRAKPGERLWVRETWCDPEDDGRPIYRADMTPRQAEEDRRVNLICRGLKGIARPWRSPIHMPRKFCRIFLELTAVRVERLRDITEDGVIAEGWERRPEVSPDPAVHIEAALDWFSDLWGSLHGPESWLANPEVVVLSFRRIEGAPAGRKEASRSSTPPEEAGDGGAPPQGPLSAVARA